MKILITAGGTKEYIDGVRYIGNSSSGKTGAVLSDYLSRQGHDVTWLGAKAAIKPRQPVAQICYETFEELAHELAQALKQHHYDVIFQAAAVSDFKVTAVLLDGQKFAAGRDVKLPTADQVELQLSKQPKLVSALKSWSLNPAVTVVAFKLTNSNDSDVRQAAVNKLINQAAINFVAHNDLHEISEQSHRFTLHSKKHTEQCDDIRALCDAILSKTEVMA
ncbi:hypothetical protein OS175_02270 [Marinicella sp. S1101]|uniref:phosphopantothenoylcysteine decarboxylase domain-containing protein n=1 Tax=Marinicella marina TaxID=2996016 RepID=UPI0022609205|nr:phosphopantothenoylcysteine decarboxylase [Marinicella marina]MCX7552691.1 hypothetical protein [Marinicella marina]MDJ1139567.1 phosphopantothenoylcysteine decarboxylase [Marinicella marina]